MPQFLSLPLLQPLFSPPLPGPIENNLDSTPSHCMVEETLTIYDGQCFCYVITQYLGLKIFLSFLGKGWFGYRIKIKLFSHTLEALIVQISDSWIICCNLCVSEKLQSYLLEVPYPRKFPSKLYHQFSIHLDSYNFMTRGGFRSDLIKFCHFTEEKGEALKW